MPALCGALSPLPVCIPFRWRELDSAKRVLFSPIVRSIDRHWCENVISSRVEKSKDYLSKVRLSLRQERILADATTAVERVRPGDD